MEALFSLGQVVMTNNLKHRLEEANPTGWFEELDGLIRRHVSGDWGDLDEHDVGINTGALKDGGRIFSAYHTTDGTKLYVITEADRSYTTALLPEDY